MKIKVRMWARYGASKWFYVPNALQGNGCKADSHGGEGTVFFIYFESF